MIPSGWLGVLLFLLLVTPGIFFDLISESRRTSQEESTLRELGRVTLASVACTATAILLMYVGAQLIGPRSVDFPALITGTRGYLARHYQLVGLTLLIEQVLALLIAYGWHRILAAYHGGANVTAVSQWDYAFEKDAPTDKHLPQARLTLSGGSAYEGRVWRWSGQMRHQNREITLMQPLHFRADIDGSWKRVPLEVKTLIIKGEAIEVIAVSYYVPGANVPPATAAAPDPPT